MIITLIKSRQVVASATIPSADESMIHKWLTPMGVGMNADGSLYSLATLPFQPLRLAIRLRPEKPVKKERSADHSIEDLRKCLASLRAFDSSYANNKSRNDLTPIFLHRIGRTLIHSDIKRIVQKCREAGVLEKTIHTEFGPDAKLLKNL